MDFDAKYDHRSPEPLQLGRDELAAMTAEISPSPLARAAPLTGGFSNHNILLEFADGDRCVLRLSPDRLRLRTEADLMAFIAEQVPTVPVPAVRWWSEDDEAAIGALALSYVDGTPLAIAEDQFTETQCRSVCEQLGAIAAAIHAVSFDVGGMLGPGPAVTEPFESYAAGTLAFLAECLESPRLQDRIGPERLARLGRCLSLPAEIVAPTMDRQLCHSDFNQKNILVREATDGSVEIAAVLDWEFAFVGSGVVDIGNLLRFEEESPSVDAERFAAAYWNAGGHLDEGWRQQSLFADLLAQASFLIGETDRPKTYATAIGVIDRTLPALGL